MPAADRPLRLAAVEWLRGQGRCRGWMHRFRLAVALVAVGASSLLVLLGRGTLWRWWSTGEFEWPQSVDGVLQRHAARVAAKYRPLVERAGRPWPPKKLALLGFKRERVLEVWSEEGATPYRLTSFPVLGQSGGLGPKRRKGDRQVPEGVYALTTLNPQSYFHLSLRVDYPNTDDRRFLEGDLGGDIYVHGGTASIGCLAMGDEAIEELFVLAALADERRILIAPVDLRRVALPAPLERSEAWLAERYHRLERELARFQ